MKVEYLSATTLDAYESCPFRFWKRKFVDPIDLKTPAMQIGSAVHKALELYHTEGLGNHSSLQLLFDDVCKEFAPLDFTRFNDMRSLLRRYELENDAECNIIAAEQKFIFPVGDYNVKGFIDRIDYLGDGKYEIIDYKTSYLKKEEDEVKSDIQGVIYDIALRYMWEDGQFPGLEEPREVTFSLHYLRYGKVSAQYTDEQRQNAKAFIEYTGNRIEMDDEPEPRLNPYCRTCEYRGDCSLFCGGWKKYLDAELFSDLDTMVELLDNYNDIKKIIEAKRAELQTNILLEYEKEQNTEYTTPNGVKGNMQSQVRKVYNIPKIMNKLPDWTKYATIDVKEILENGTPEEVAVVKQYQTERRTSPYIRTRKSKY